MTWQTSSSLWHQVRTHSGKCCRTCCSPVTMELWCLTAAAASVGWHVSAEGRISSQSTSTHLLTSCAPRMGCGTRHSWCAEPSTIVDLRGLVLRLRRILRVLVLSLHFGALLLSSLLAAVYGWMLERMPTMRAIQVCNAVFAMGRLNLYNAELMDALLQVRMHWQHWQHW